MLHSSKIVEVKPKGVSKRIATASIMRHHIEKRGPPDFVIAMGEDRTDELVRALSEYSLVLSSSPAAGCTQYCMVLLREWTAQAGAC